MPAVDAAPLGRPHGARLVDRTFVAITLATFFHFCAVGVNLPVLPQFVTDELGANGVGVGVVLGAYSVAAILVRPAVSRVGTRWGPRTMLWLGPALGVPAFALCAVAGNVVVLVVLRMVVGVAETLHFVGAVTIINELAPAHRRAEAASYYSVAVFGGLGVGPLVGESLVAADGARIAFLVAAAASLASCAVAATVTRTVGRAVAASAARVATPLLHGKALATGWVLALGIFGFTAWNAFVTLQARDVGLGNATGLFVAYSALVLAWRVLGAKVPERVGLARCAATALVFTAAGLGVIATWRSPAGLYVGTVVLAVGSSLLYPSLQTMTVNSVPDEERAAVVSTFTMFFEIGGAAGALTLGVAADVAGYPGAFGLACVVVLLGLPVLWRAVVRPPGATARPRAPSEASAAPARGGASPSAGP